MNKTVENLHGRKFDFVHGDNIRHQTPIVDHNDHSENSPDGNDDNKAFE